MAVNVELSVSGLSQFKTSMNDAQASVKTLDAALKANEKSMKATGASESYVATQTGLLNQKLKEQGNIAKSAEAALKQMEANGVKPTSAAYQNMARKAIEARSAMLDTEQQIRELGESSVQAAGQADQLTDSVNAIGKKISLDQVISGINGITGALEKAGKKAIDVGKQIWENITDSARWADDAATMATILDMDVEDYQRYKKVFDTVGDITVSEWAKMKQKVQKAIVEPTDDQSALFDLLGISTHEILQGAHGPVQGMAKSYEEIFWQVSRELQRRVENGSMTQGTADVYAQALFGKNFANLKPLIALGEQGFKDALAEQNVVSEESVNKLATMNDELIKLQGNFETLKADVLAGLAPALTKGTEVLNSLLGRLMEYLRSPDGQKALESLETAVSGLFEDLGKIDPEQVVNGFVDVFNKIIGGLEWLVDNKDSVIRALEAIVIGWGALKITGGVLNILQLINGLQGLAGGGAAAGAGAASGGAGAGAGAGGSTAAAAGGGLWAKISAGTKAFFSSTAWMPAAVIAAGTLPAIFANNADYANSEQIRQARISAVSGATGVNAQFVRDAAEALVLRGGENKDYAAIESLLMGLSSRQNQQKAELYNVLSGAAPTAGNNTWNLLNSFWNGAELDPYVVDELLQNITDAFAADENKKVQVPIEPDVPDDAAATIAREIGPVEIQVTPNFSVEDIEDPFSHANGIWSVPWDGYPAILHRGERVMPAREVTSRNYSSNLYVESMYMNNGTDAAGLASAMAAAQRRTQAGFGS